MLEPPRRLAAVGEEASWLLSSSVRPSEEVVELGRLFLGAAPSAEVGRRDMLLASKSEGRLAELLSRRLNSSTWCLALP